MEKEETEGRLFKYLKINKHTKNKSLVQKLKILRQEDSENE